MKIEIEKLGRIGVLMGGYSSEREISLKSGTAIAQALKNEGGDVVAVDITEKDEKKIASRITESGMDVAFIALHGRLGEDGAIQAILEGLNIPYTGSGVEASRLAINKTLAQSIFKSHGISVPAYVILERNANLSEDFFVKELGNPPWVVKPACEGSSIGISLVETIETLEKAIKTAESYGEKVLVERFIKGRELTVGILQEKPLPIVEICFSRTFFDFTAKYKQGFTEYLVPADLPGDITLKLQAEALKAHQALGCRDFSRVDIILAADGGGYILEINTIPGFTSTSLLPKAAKAAGIEFNQLCLQLVELAYGQKKETESLFIRN